ncbi:MAG: helix-turn-helix domain-containing protein, partial [Bellilinea sp.]|nr:helix-turn-helix domain-containing protein [Bellilinea sp.]
MKLTIGQYLRQLREERGITLEQLAQATRINPIYLRALENDEPSLLPSAVHGRGYLRLIAGAFNIDPQPLLAAFPDKEVTLPSQTEAEPTPEITGQSVTAQPSETEESPQEEEEQEIIPETISEITEISTDEAALEPPPLEGSSSFVFSQIGQQFRSQREALGISLQDAERFPRLKARYLQAIEEGRLDQLPSLVQGRGMLRNYAEFLNLDSEAILLQFADGLQRRRLEHLAAPAPARSAPYGSQAKLPNRFSLFLRKWMTPDLLVGGLLFLILLVFVIWGTARVSGLQDQEAQTTPPSISELLLNTADIGNSTAQTPTPSSTPSSAQGNGLVLPPPSVEGEEASPTGQPPLSTDPVQVYVIANQRVWLRVVVDNRVAFEGRT